MYIADRTNHRIRLVTTSTSVITTVVGTGYTSFDGDGGAATSASLYFPQDVALDTSGISSFLVIFLYIYNIYVHSQGNLYIADTNNHRVRKVTISTGIINTIAGSSTSTSGSYSGDNGAATSACLFGPSGVTLDSSGNVYIADTSNHRVRKVTISTSIITTFAGTGTAAYGGDGGDPTSADLRGPYHVAVDTSGTIQLQST